MITLRICTTLSCVRPPILDLDLDHCRQVWETGGQQAAGVGEEETGLDLDGEEVDGP